MKKGSTTPRRARRFGLLILALLVVAGAWILVPDPPGAAAVDDERAIASSERDDGDVRLTAVDASSSSPLATETPASSRVAVEARATLDIDLRAPGTSAKPAADVDSGKLTVRAVDDVTREPLDHLRVRAASATRIADRDTGPRVTRVALTLTPDTYTPLVLVAGYEPAELAPVRIDDGAEIELTAAMHRGSASITGVVIGSGVASHVELTGAGRRPCDRCADSTTGEHSSVGRTMVTDVGRNRRGACPHCGFAADSTRIPVGLAATFAFTDLASGTYALRLTDDRGRSDGAQLLVVLLEAQHVRVGLAAPVLRDVLVNLIDVDQASLAAVWGANARANADDAAHGSDSADLVVADLVWRFAVHEGSEFIGRGEFSTPTPIGITAGRIAAFGGRKLGKGLSVDDRTRRADEDLRPSAPAPKFPEVVLESSVCADGLVRIAGVPTYELSIRLTCEPFLGTVTVPESIGTTVVHAQLERTSERRLDEDSDPATFRALDAGRYR